MESFQSLTPYVVGPSQLLLFHTTSATTKQASDMPSKERFFENSQEGSKHSQGIQSSLDICYHTPLVSADLDDNMQNNENESNKAQSALQETNDVCEKPRDTPLLTSSSEEEFDIFVRRGRACLAIGKFEEAIFFYRKALFLKNKTISDEPNDIQATYSDLLMDIGDIHGTIDFGNIYKSLDAYQLCLDIRRKCFGATHTAVASALYKLAQAYYVTRDSITSYNLLTEALSILHATEPQGRATADVWFALGQVLASLGKLEDAMSSYEEADRIVRARDQ